MEPAAKTETERDQRLVRFLLGAVSPEERAQIEEDLFAEDDLDEQLRAATDDLIQEYLAGKLSDEDRRRFESHFLASPLHRERLDFMEDLLAAAERERHGAKGSHPADFRFRAGFAAAVILVGAIVLAWSLWVRPRAAQQASDRPTAAPPSPTTSATPLEPDGPRHARQPGEDRRERVEIVALPPDGASTAVRVVVGDRAQVLRFRVPVPGPHPTFRAILKDGRGSQVWHAEELVPWGREEPLVLEVPADLLAGGDYLLTVEGESVRQGSPAALAVPVRYRLRVERVPGSPAPRP